MSNSTTPTPQQTEDRALYRDVLNRHIRKASEIADRAHAMAEAATTPAELAHAAETHARVLRNIRRSIVLATRLASGALFQAPAHAPAKAAPDRAEARREILRRTEDAIERKARVDRETDAEALCTELYERMDAPDWDTGLDHIPLDILIDNLCRDLGAHHNGKNHVARRRTPADIRELTARANNIPARPPAWQQAS